MFLGVGWGGAITFTYLRTPMMLRHGTFTCTCAHTSCYIEDVSRHGGVGWGGVGWGNNVHVLAHSHDVTPRHVHLHVRTYVMLRWRCVTSRWGGVGWGGAITFTYLRTPMMLRHGTFTCTCAHTSCYVEDVSRHGGVGWGGAITFTYLRTPMHDVTPRQVHLHVRTYVMLRKNPFVKKIPRHAETCWKNLLGSYWHHRLVLAYDQRQCSRSVDILPRKRTKIEWPHLDVRSHMAVAMGGKCSWKSPAGENRCVLSDDVEITGKNGCRWGFGHADFSKGTFFALRHVNYIQ